MTTGILVNLEVDWPKIEFVMDPFRNVGGILCGNSAWLGEGLIYWQVGSLVQ